MSILGTRVVRTEDPALLTVGGRYVDDVAPSDALWMTVVRSLVPHARIANIDTASAADEPGVVLVATAADLDLVPRPHEMARINQQMTRTWLAGDRVRYVGEPVAVLLTETREQGVDAAEAVVVDYDTLPLVLDPAQSVLDDELLFPEAGTNASFRISSEQPPDLFAGCDHVVELAFRNQRVAPCPMEPRAAAARWGDDGRLTQWSSTQFPHSAKGRLAEALGVDSEMVRVITPDVGGGFGAKNGTTSEEILVALLAKKVERPVRWAETRSESMLGLVHGRAQDFRAKLGGSSTGDLQAYSLSVVQDAGAYPEIGSILPMMTRIMTSGVYDIPKVHFEAVSTVTNTMPVGAYRGAGRPEATHALERMVDLFAQTADLDPVEVRRRNFLAPEAFPLKTPTGAKLDSGEYDKALSAALTAAGYEELRQEQSRRRSAGNGEPLLGIGLCSYVEITNPAASSEFGSLEILDDGSALARTGTSPHGQGHYTTFAMLISEATGIPMERIEVRHGDTDDVPRGGGTGGSRSLQAGGSALAQASDAVVDLAKSLAADQLEANPDDIVLDTEQGTFSVTGTPAIAVTWSEIAAAAKLGDQPLAAEVDFEPDGATFPFGTHVAVIEIDPEIGHVTLLRHVACDDAGVIVNPLLVDGQVHGGLAQGIAQALMEEFSYDADGNPITANFMDYGFISTMELPNFERVSQETPSPLNPLGAKGIGESGTIGATPAIQNAVVDALRPLGVTHVDIPLTAERVWRAMQDPS